MTMLNMVPAPFTESDPRFVPVWSTSLVRSKSNLDYCFQNILAGALYGLSGGLAFVCIFTAVGATLAYLLSRTFYREGIHKLFPDKFRAIELKLNENKDRLFYFMIFIRVVPVSPGWAINLVSPLLDVPIATFFITSLIG